MAIIGTQQERRHQVVNHNTANAATKHMTQDAHFTIVRTTGSSKKKTQHAVGYEYIHMEVNGRQLTVQCMASVCRELCDQFIVACNREPPWSTEAFVHTNCETEHLDVISSGIVADEYPDNHPCEWTKQAVITLERATEEYMVEVIAESHCWKQQLISCRFSIWLLLWQGKGAGYSWHSPTCAWHWICLK